MADFSTPRSPALHNVAGDAQSSLAWNLAALVILGAAGGLVYCRAVNAPFVFDDQGSVVGNPSIVRLWPLLGDAEHPGPLNPPPDLPTSGRPVVNLSLALNYCFGQLDPVGYRMFNFVVHVFSAMLLMDIVRRTLRLEFFGGRFERASAALGLAVAVLWAVHPLQTETVVYVTQRTELLVGFFYLATLDASLRYWNAATSGARTTWLIAATLSCCLGMGTKEVMVTAPVIVLLFERTFVAGTFRRALRQSWPLYAGLFLSWGLLLILNYSAPRSETAGFHLGVPAFAWWLTQAKVLLLYFKLAVWPWPLAIHYGSPYLTTLGAAWPWVLAAAVIVTVALVWRRTAIGFVGAAVLIILSPTLLIPIVTEVAAERRMYLPLAALIALVVVGGYGIGQRAAGRRMRGADQRALFGFSEAALAGTVLLLAIVLSFVSIQRLAAYQSEFALWEDSAAHQPEDPISRFNLANELSRTDRKDEALAQYGIALQLKPDYADAHNNLANLLADAGKMDEAITHYQQAMQARPKRADIHNNLGLVLTATGKLPEAMSEYQSAIRLQPGLADAYNNYGSALVKTNRPQEARAQFTKALELRPGYANAHFNLGNLLLSSGEVQPAIEHYRRAMELKPGFAHAAANLAQAYAQAQQPAEAIAAAEQALAFAERQHDGNLARQVKTWLTDYRSQQAK